jgi:hypothetical protein
MNPAHNVLSVTKTLRDLFSVPLLAISRLAKPVKRSPSPGQPSGFLGDCSDRYRTERTSSRLDKRPRSDLPDMQA